MLKENRIAFKEWAAVVEALGSGRQILILRKGGVHEKQGRFEVEHREFFLFPTFEHQNPRDLKPEGQAILRNILEEKPEPAVLPICHYCVVEGAFWIADQKALQDLDPFHIWSWECVRTRFERGERKGLFGIVVRTYAFPKAVTLENLKRYGGCRSWVGLERSLGTSSLRPVLSEDSFEEHPLHRSFKYQKLA